MLCCWVSFASCWLCFLMPPKQPASRFGGMEAAAESPLASPPDSTAGGCTLLRSPRSGQFFPLAARDGKPQFPSHPPEATGFCKAAPNVAQAMAACHPWACSPGQTPIGFPPQSLPLLACSDGLLTPVRGSVVPMRVPELAGACFPRPSPSALVLPKTPGGARGWSVSFLVNFFPGQFHPPAGTW